MNISALLLAAVLAASGLASLMSDDAGGSPVGALRPSIVSVGSSGPGVQPDDVGGSPVGRADVGGSPVGSGHP